MPASSSMFVLHAMSGSNLRPETVVFFALMALFLALRCSNKQPPERKQNVAYDT